MQEGRSDLRSRHKIDHGKGPVAGKAQQKTQLTRRLGGYPVGLAWTQLDAHLESLGITGQALPMYAAELGGLAPDWAKSMEKNNPGGLFWPPDGVFRMAKVPINILPMAVCWGDPHAARGRPLLFQVFRANIGLVLGAFPGPFPGSSLTKNHGKGCP